VRTTARGLSERYGCTALKKNPDSHIWVNEIREEDEIYGSYLVRTKRLGMTRNGDPFLSLTLADRSGEIEAKVWERANELSALFDEGDVIEVAGRANSYRGQLQVTLSGLKVVKEVPDISLFLEKSSKSISEMMGSLREILGEITDSHMRALVEKFLSDRHFMSLFKKAPAAKNFHHNYIGGLLEHTLSVCQLARMVADHYPELDRNLLLTGAFLHDIGKVKELQFERQIDYTDEGRLLGHLVSGVSMVKQKLGALKNFPTEISLRLEHLILSHHGTHEFGSPKRPKFLEAFALHLIDDLDAKVNGLGRFIEKDTQKGDWTDFNRLFERYFLKGRVQSAEKNEDPGLREDKRQRALF